MDSGSKYSYRQVTSPSAHDPERNRHRFRVAWNKFAVRVILINPRYTGYQVWNKQRKDEALIDVEDVALGHTTKLRWNDNGTWLWLDKIVRALAAAQSGDERRIASQVESASKIAECDRKLAQYRAALDAGVSPAAVGGWIAETEAEKARYEVGLRQEPKARKRMTEQEIRPVVDKLAEVAHVLADADPNGKSEIFRQHE